ncbi:ATP-binding protein [Leucobacter sp. wl10]|uniref:ATP-binding protein n=1 Tax=Leucobacter sp. wl10 TaxID=2304677 RepID=UPI001968E0E1|nr:ATP-binding protein [Leucobacter sp. wl10]
MNASLTSPMGRILPRRSRNAIEDALADTRVVLITGARQCGKSTLVNQVTRARDAEWRSLDRAATRQAALFDPTSFVEADDLLVIDEVQRAPELLLSIKERVDADPRPGQYLLTGSAQVLGLRSVPDALPGRMETIELWPLSQGEIDETPDGFIDAVFTQGSDFRCPSELRRDDYIERIVRGGFPEAVAREGKRRESFFDNYISDIINRDVIQLSEIERGAQMRALVRMLAARSGGLLVPGSLANALGLPQTTVARYLGLLEEVFLIKRIPAWSRNLSARATSTPKVALVDSGVAANLLGQDAKSLRHPESPLGGLLESFVTMELSRQLSWSRTRAEMHHYRTKDKVEVDIVLEDRRGRVIALDVKASATVRSDDFRGIDHLAARLGGDLVVGVVLYTGTETLAFGEKKIAVPISAIWRASP